MWDVAKKRFTKTLREIFFPADVESLYRVEAWFWTLENILASEKLRELLLLLISQQADLVPIKWEYFENESYQITKEDIGTTLQQWQKKVAKEPNDRLWIYLKGKSSYRTWYWLELNHTEEHPFSSVHVYLDDVYFRDGDKTEVFLDFLEKLYCFCNAEYLICSHTLDLEKKYMQYIRYPKEVNIPTFWQKPAAYMPPIGWLTIVGPRYASLINSKFESFNGYRKQMYNGGIMLLTSENPLEYGEKRTLRCEENLKKVLPGELFFNPSNPSGPYLSPYYPIACSRWMKQDEFSSQVETHLYTVGSKINKIRLTHRPTGLSVSKPVGNREIDVLQQELLFELRERFEKTQ